MAHDVLFGESDDRNVLHPFQNGHGLLQSARLAFGKIGLRQIARDDHLAPVAEACQKHFHLFAGGVLRFVQNDERVGERPSAHIGKGRDFDDALFHEFCICLEPEHLLKGVVEGAKVWIDLGLQIAREETELFARFHGGTGQNDLFHLLALVGGDGEADGKVRLTRARRPHAEGDGIALDGGNVLLLPHRLALDGLAARRDGNDAVHQRADVRSVPFARKFDAIQKAALIDVVPRLDDRKQALDDLFAEGGVFRLSFEDDVRPLHFGEEFELPRDGDEVFVEDPEDLLEPVQSARFDGVSGCRNPFLLPAHAGHCI